MRYKYRVRLFYAVVFLVVGLALGYYAGANNDSFRLGSFERILSLIPAQEEKPAVEDAVIPGIQGMGVILPKSELSIKNAIDLAVLDFSFETGKKLDVSYKYAECSPDDISSALSELEKSKISHVYGMFCDESIKAAVETFVENKLVLIMPPIKKEMSWALDAGSIKIKANHKLTRNMNRFAVAYKALYKQEPGMFDAISYDVVNVVALMMDKKEVTGYEGVTGKISLDGNDKIYLISIE